MSSGFGFTYIIITYINVTKYDGAVFLALRLSEAKSEKEKERESPVASVYFIHSLVRSQLSLCVCFGISVHAYIDDDGER